MHACMLSSCYAAVCAARCKGPLLVPLSASALCLHACKRSLLNAAVCPGMQGLAADPLSASALGMHACMQAKPHKRRGMPGMQGRAAGALQRQRHGDGMHAL